MASNFNPNSAASDLDLAVNDLGPLAWVLDELRKSLETASSALRRFVRDADQARGSDLGSVDGGHLRIARQQLHQAVGALEMVLQGKGRIVDVEVAHFHAFFVEAFAQFIQQIGARQGDAIAAHTQGLVHAREPLQDGERVTLLAIALAPAPRRSPRKPSVTAD